jgi:hypothetical protein
LCSADNESEKPAAARNVADRPSFSSGMEKLVGKVSAEELRRRAAQYRLLAHECAYPEGVDLLLLMADVHEDEAAAAQAEADGSLIARPISLAS